MTGGKPMPNEAFRKQLLSGAILVVDGATGSNLQARGLARGAASECWVLERPEEILQLHRDFITAGADILLTSTFGGTALRLEGSGLSERATEINQRAVELARQAAAESSVYVAGSIGPLGQLLQPFGPLSEDVARNAYMDQARWLTEAGVDLIVIETQFDLNEATIAVMAVHSVSDLPLVCSLSYDRGTRTMMGITPRQAADALGKLSIDAIGINCGRSLEDNLAALKELRQATSLPIWFKPNAGLPSVDEQGNSVYTVTPEAMGSQVPAWLAAGAQFIGGCCGTSPAHLHRIAQAIHAA
jgi:5-methyltetrahydrofolate--homocysteine methyltransferase